MQIKYNKYRDFVEEYFRVKISLEPNVSLSQNHIRFLSLLYDLNDKGEDINDIDLLLEHCKNEGISSTKQGVYNRRTDLAIAKKVILDRKKGLRLEPIPGRKSKEPVKFSLDLIYLGYD